MGEISYIELDAEIQYCELAVTILTEDRSITIEEWSLRVDEIVARKFRALDALHKAAAP